MIKIMGFFLVKKGECVRVINSYQKHCLGMIDFITTKHQKRIYSLVSESKRITIAKRKKDLKMTFQVPIDSSIISDIVMTKKLEEIDKF